MAIKSFNPYTPTRRYQTVLSSDGLTKKRPERRLLDTKKRSGGRNSYGRVTARGIGGGHKKKYRIIDFKRKRFGEVAEVIGIEYDPNRSARIALVRYADGLKSYILASDGLKVGSKVSSGPGCRPDVGNFMPLKEIPVGSAVHSIELHRGRGGQMARSAGSSATIMAITDGYAQLKMPSGEIRKVHEDCFATVGRVGNKDHEKVVLGKAGRRRYLGKRPITRAVAKNPVDHPMGGGAGKTSGGGHPVTPWGVLTRGYKTRKRRKYSNSMIIARRDGQLFKRR